MLTLTYKLSIECYWSTREKKDFKSNVILCCTGLKNAAEVFFDLCYIFNLEMGLANGIMEVKLENLSF